jgi:hypothetical protein
MFPKNLLCFSPIRWDFIMYRPQQLLVRFAEQSNVYFFEEPVFDAVDEAYLSYATRSETLWKLVPHLPPGLNELQTDDCLSVLLDEFLEAEDLDRWSFWYYTPSVLSFTEKYNPKVVIYDWVEEKENYLDWNAIFLSVRKQINAKLPFCNAIHILHE